MIQWKKRGLLLRIGALLGLAFLTLSVIAAPKAFGQSSSITKINFDDVLANPSPVVGVPLQTYLAKYGISVLSESRPNTVGILDAFCEYGGCTFAAAVIASSPPNIFTQFDGTASGTNSYTLGFSSSLASLSFTRVELVAGTNGITHPQWTAQAFNAGGQLIASVGEGLISSFTNVPPAIYTLGPVAGQTISKVTISGNAFNFAAFGSPILDDFVLTHSSTPAAVLLSIINSSDQQTGNIQSQLTNPLLVKATNPDGSPAVSVSISFDVTVGAAGVSLTNTTATTGADGTASTLLTIGNLPGLYQVQASCAGSQICSPGVVTFTAYGSCLLPQSPEFNWSQSQSHDSANIMWGANAYDHSYYLAYLPADVSPPAVSQTGTMRLMMGSTAFPPIQLASSQNSLAGLTAALNTINGINAILQGSNLSIYNNACIFGTSCVPRSAFILMLCDGSGVCDNDNNLLKPKTISEVGCALTVLAIACNFVQTNSLNILPSPSSTSFNPASLNDFMSKALSSTTPGGQFKGNGDVNWKDTVSAVNTNTGLHMSFVPQAISSQPDSTDANAMLDSTLCSAKLPVIVKVSSPDGNDHFVLVKGNNGQGSTPSDGSEYIISDPGFSFQTLKDYQNNFTTVGFVKDPVDRSSLSASVEDAADIEIIDPSGRATGFNPATQSIVKQIPSSSYLQDHIGDDTGQGHDEGMTRWVDIETPQTGTYQIVVTGLTPGKTSVSISGISQAGSNNSHVDQTIITSSGSTAMFAIQYSPVPGVASQVQFLATFQSTLADIAACLKMDWIHEEGIANSLSQKIQTASQSDGTARLNQLNAFVNEVTAQSGKQIGSAAAEVLLQDANSLMAQNR